MDKFFNTQPGHIALAVFLGAGLAVLGHFFADIKDVLAPLVPVAALLIKTPPAAIPPSNPGAGI